MDMILSVVQYFIDLGAAVMLPLVIFVIAILLGTPLERAVKSGICKIRYTEFCILNFQNAKILPFQCSESVLRRNQAK